MKRVWEDFKKAPGWVKGGVGVALFIVVIAVGAGLEGEEEQQPSKAAAPERQAPAPERNMEEVEEELTPELVVDLMEVSEPGTIKKMCRGTETLGPELALAAYKRGYKPAGPNSPNAADVFAEVLTRC